MFTSHPRDLVSDPWDVYYDLRSPGSPVTWLLWHPKDLVSDTWDVYLNRRFSSGIPCLRMIPRDP